VGDSTTITDCPLAEADTKKSRPCPQEGEGCSSLLPGRELLTRTVSGKGAVLCVKKALFKAQANSFRHCDAPRGSPVALQSQCTALERPHHTTVCQLQE